MTASMRSLLYRSARIQQEIEAEQHRSRPNWLRLIRLKRLRLMLTNRLRAIFRGAAGDLYAGRPVLAC